MKYKKYGIFNAIADEFWSDLNDDLLTFESLDEAQGFIDQELKSRALEADDAAVVKLKGGELTVVLGGSIKGGLHITHLLDDARGAERIVEEALANGVLAEAIRVLSPAEKGNFVDSLHGNYFAVIGYGLDDGVNLYGPFPGEEEVEEFGEMVARSGQWSMLEYSPERHPFVHQLRSELCSKRLQTKDQVEIRINAMMENSGLLETGVEYVRLRMALKSQTSLHLLKQAA